MVDVVTMGETMMLFQPLLGEPFRYAPLVRKNIAGSESNVAIGLTRLGHKVRWVSRLGNDPFGEEVRSVLAGEGIDISSVMIDESAPTAVFFKDFKQQGRDPAIYYYRDRSAASRLTPEDVSESWFEGARHFHVTGITPALGQSTAEATLLAMQTAKAKGLTVSFDPNIRRKLWSEQKARKTIMEMIPHCDYFFPGIDEAEFLLGTNEVDVIAARFLEMGVKLVVIKLGAQGSVAFTAHRKQSAAGVHVAQIVDTVGAGDAFAVGCLHVLLTMEANAFAANADQAVMDQKLLHMLEVGNMMGALTIQFRGDWEGLPTLAELTAILNDTEEITR